MKKLVLIQIFLAFFSGVAVYGQAIEADSLQAVTDTLNQDFGLFTRDEILHLALRFDLKEYTRKKPKEEYMNAILTYYINAKDSINRNVRLRSRGVFRNGYCSFPPVLLNFKKADFEKPDIKKIGKIKLVTHCQSGNEEYVFKEYLIYKLFNVLTDTSFRVRLAEIDYISTSGKQKVIRSYGFFIEPLDLLAERIGAAPVETPALRQDNIIPRMMDRVAIFNYMIGNTDWSVTGQHNCKVLSGLSFGTPGLGIIVPYDFDYAGLINTHYAAPAEGLSIENVTQRYYQGLCREEEVYANALKEFAGKKEEFYKVIREFSLLSEKDRQRMTDYLEGFFSNLEDEGTLPGIFENQCREK